MNIDINMNIDITPPHPMPPRGPSDGRPRRGGEWGDINNRPPIIKTDLFSKGRVVLLKNVPREKRHQWYLGLSIHTKLLFIILNILFIGILINYYILLAIAHGYSLWLFPVSYSLLPIPYYPFPIGYSLLAIPYCAPVCWLLCILLLLLCGGAIY